jgi:hypothetical protein
MHELRQYVQLSEGHGSGLVFEAGSLFLEARHPLFDSPEPNDACFRNDIDLAKDFWIERVISPEIMDDGANCEQ